MPGAYRRNVRGRAFGADDSSTDNCVSSLRILVSPVPHTCAEGAGMALVMAAMPRRSGRAAPTHAVVESRVERMNGGPGAVASRGSRHGGVRPARTTGEPQASGGVLHHGTGFRSGAPAPAPRLAGDRGRPPKTTHARLTAQAHAKVSQSHHHRFCTTTHRPPRRS